MSRLIPARAALAAIAVIVLASTGLSTGGAQAATPASAQIDASGLGLQADSDVSSGSLANLYDGESIYFLTRLVHGSTLAGTSHRLDYRWYAGDKLELQFGGMQKLAVPPASFWAVVHPGHFAPGPHRAVLLVDGAVVDEHVFDVHAGSRPLDQQPALRPAQQETIPSDQAIRDAITAQARSWLQSGDTDAFDGAADRYRRTGERTPAGYWKLAALYHVANDIHVIDGSAPLWTQLDHLCVHWLDRRPGSIAAVIMRAKLMVAQAWATRGTAPASEVGTFPMEMFKAHIEAARQVLESHASIAAQDPEWDALRITVAMAQGAAPDEILRRAGEALARHPLYYGIHFAAEKALEPRWGGSEGSIKRYVAMAMERSRPYEGNQAYVRIYFNVAKNARNAVSELNLTGAKLQQMVESYGEVLRAYPDPHNREVARALMCLGSDAAHYRSLGRRGKEAVPSLAWWDTPAWRLECDQAAFEGITHPGPLLDQLSGMASFLQGFGEEFWRAASLIALGLWLAMEGFFRLGVRRAARSSPPAAVDPYDPERYPRTYYASWGQTALSNRWAVRMAVLGFTFAWAFSTVPWPDRAFDTAVFLLCVGAGLAGLSVVVLRVSSRVILMSDAVEVRILWTRRRLTRDAIMGRSPLSAGDQSVVLYPHLGMGSPLSIPAVGNPDGVFWQWIAPLKELARTPG